MALEHAILVSLTERAGSGYELARRFDRSIGYFWPATHQQIYRVLRRMDEAGWVKHTEIAQDGETGHPPEDGAPGNNAAPPASP